MSQIMRDEWNDSTRTVDTLNANGDLISQRAYTPAENAGADRRAADVLAGTNDTDLRSKANAALDANAAFLALGSPTNAQTVAQVQRLTRECSALIRLMLRALTTVDGT